MSRVQSGIGRFVCWVRLRMSRFGIGNFANSLSVPEIDLLNDLAGKHIAIVGNARALADQAHGADIDAADIVIRINRAPMPAISSHGSRTDWLALATSLSKTETARINPRRILWMSPKRKRLRLWVAETAGFYLYPLEQHRQFSDMLRAPPTTGLMVIQLVARTKAASVTLYGFDFFASLSLTGSRTMAQVPHDFAAERAWVENLSEQDARISVKS